MMLGSDIRNGLVVRYFRSPKRASDPDSCNTAANSEIQPVHSFCNLWVTLTLVMPSIICLSI